MRGLFTTHSTKSTIISRVSRFYRLPFQPILPLSAWFYSQLIVQNPQFSVNYPDFRDCHPNPYYHLIHLSFPEVPLRLITHFANNSSLFTAHKPFQCYIWLLFVQSTRTQNFAKNHLNPVVLVLIGYWISLTEYSQMSTHISGFQSFFRLMHHFVWHSIRAKEVLY